MSKHPIDPNHIIIPYSEVDRLVGGASRNTIRRWEQSLGFPLHIAISPQKCGWWKDEILAWLELGRGRAGRFPEKPDNE